MYISIISLIINFNINAFCEILIFFLFTEKKNEKKMLIFVVYFKIINATNYDHKLYRILTIIEYFYYTSTGIFVDEIQIG